MAKVRAKCDHTEPKSHTYRKEGETFEYNGPPYAHIEQVKGKPAGEDEDEDEGDEKPKR